MLQSLAECTLHALTIDWFALTGIGAALDLAGPLAVQPSYEP